MIVIECRRASAKATALFPAAVGPATTGMSVRSSPAKAALELAPREMDNRGPSMDVVRRQLRGRERGEERAHLRGRHDVPRLDRRLAGDSRGKPLMAGSG